MTTTGPMIEDPVGDLCAELGEDRLRSIVAGFYAKVATDDLLRPLYPDDDLAGAERRLADFLVERCGGPDCYSRGRGHPRLRMRHAPFRIDRAARDRWVERMTEAVRAAVISEQPRARLLGFVGEVATFLINRPEPPP